MADAAPSIRAAHGKATRLALFKDDIAAHQERHGLLVKMPRNAGKQMTCNNCAPSDLCQKTTTACIIVNASVAVLLAK
jgi:hypothetical protein